MSEEYKEVEMRKWDMITDNITSSNGAMFCLFGPICFIEMKFSDMTV